MGTFSDLAILVIIAAVKIALVLFILLTGIAYTTWLERKVVAHMQARWGPYLVGPHGLLQPLADDGGISMTFALGPGSSAIDHATDCPTTDQRGEPRTNPCDTGAYEAR